MENQICIPIRAELYNEFILRMKENVDVGGWINNIVEDFLERTEDDGHIWPEEYMEDRAVFSDSHFLKSYGDPKKGHHWKNVFLPNGTKLKMTYQGTDSIAEVKHQQIIFNHKECTPSSFANTVANNTSRNAWRDIWVQFPGDSEWKFANNLRS